MTLRFVTDDGIEVPAVTASQMREIDRIAVEETGPNLWQMMENAGRSLALLAIDLLGSRWERAEILVLAGAGGNGGGGICAARHLANHGARVRLCLAKADRLGEVPAHQRKVFHATAGREVDRAALLRLRPDLVLDALIGYGLTAAPRGTAADLIDWANRTSTRILSLDLPSGIDATTGEAPGAIIRAAWTITLALPKTGLRPERTGALFLADLGIPAGVYRRLALQFRSPFTDRFTLPLRCLGHPE